MKKNEIFQYYTLVIEMTAAAALLIFTLAFLPGGDSEAEIKFKKAEVIKDRSNKQNISGFIHIAFAWGDQLTPPQHLARGFINLKEAMHRWTKIETIIDSHMFLSSPELLRMPFVYVTTDRSFELSEIEQKNLKKYFDAGGFMFLETATPAVENNQAGAALKQMLRDTLGSQARFAPISNKHPVYHCFFDFDDGPPQGAEINGSGGAFIRKQIFYLEGVWYNDRLIAVYSDKGYIVKWNDMTNNEPQLKIGVNMVIFSLIQEGGITDD